MTHFCSARIVSPVRKTDRKENHLILITPSLSKRDKSSTLLNRKKHTIRTLLACNNLKLHDVRQWNVGTALLWQFCTAIHTCCLRMYVQHKRFLIISLLSTPIIKYFSNLFSDQPIFRRINAVHEQSIMWTKKFVNALGTSSFTCFVIDSSGTHSLLYMYCIQGVLKTVL